LPNVIGLRKEDELNWDCVTQTEKIRNAYKILVKEVWGGGKRNIIELDVREVGRESVDWNNLTLDWVIWYAVVTQ
jgi:hypothetical protein